MGQVILVTGASGFVGKHMVSALMRNSGYQILATGRNSAIPKDFPSGVEYVSADLSDWKAVMKLCQGRKIDTILHFAAMASLKDVPEDRERMLETNVKGMFSILELARESGSRLMFTSTGMVYGDQPGPFREAMTEKPVNFYGLSKHLCEEMIKGYIRRYDLKALILRPPIIYGPDAPQHMFISSLIKALLTGEPFAMTEGKQIRDFLYINDFVEAVELSLRKNLTGTFNISTGLPSTMAEVAITAGEILGVSDQIKLGALEYRPSELWEYYMESALLQKALNWFPNTSLREGLEHVIAHERSAARHAV